tara:strand:- start:18 stop:392 length:375 start_codon:yes stop_codon:yes gene_type:complete
MPITLIRTRFTERSQKNRAQAQNEGDHGGRQEQAEALCNRAGCRLVDAYVSLITNEAVLMVEGSLEQIARIKAVLRRSGAFSSIEVDILYSLKEMAEDRPAVMDLETVWKPPDQDEIDRMLLEE